jgi:hypothetical protein
MRSRAKNTPDIFEGVDLLDDLWLLAKRVHCLAKDCRLWALCTLLLASWLLWFTEQAHFSMAMVGPADASILVQIVLDPPGIWHELIDGVARWVSLAFLRGQGHAGRSSHSRHETRAKGNG